MFSSTEHRLHALQEISGTELRRLILSSPPKSCELDPVPTFLLQEVIDDLLPFLTALCNSSIREASLPDSQKRSILLPLIKQDAWTKVIQPIIGLLPMLLSYLKF